MICIHCGTANPDDSRFCNSCGNIIQKKENISDPAEQRTPNNRGPVIGMRPLFNPGTTQPSSLPPNNQQASPTQNKPSSPVNDRQNENSTKFTPIPTNPNTSPKPPVTTTTPMGLVKPPVTQNNPLFKKLFLIAPIISLVIVVLIILISNNSARTSRLSTDAVPMQAMIDQSGLTIPSEIIPVPSEIATSTDVQVQVFPTEVINTPIALQPTLATFAFGYNLEFMLTYDKNSWKTGKEGNFNTLELIYPSDCVISHNKGMGAPEWWERNISQETIGLYIFRVEQWTDVNTNKVVLVTYNIDEKNLSLAIKSGSNTNNCLDAARQVLDYSVKNDFGPIE